MMISKENAILAAKRYLDKMGIAPIDEPSGKQFDLVYVAGEGLIGFCRADVYGSESEAYDSKSAAERDAAEWLAENPEHAGKTIRFDTMSLRVHATGMAFIRFYTDAFAAEAA